MIFCVEDDSSIRELMLGFGRSAGILILLAFPKVQLGYVIAIVVLTLTQFATVGLSKYTLTLLKREEKEQMEDGEPAEA